MRPSWARPTRAALATAWLLLLGLPLAALSGELLCVLERHHAAGLVAEYRQRHPAFDGDAPHTAAGQALWKTPWEEYRPGARIELEQAGERYVVQINSLGFRTREFSAHKPPGLVRVVCVGGSTTFLGRTNDETYPALLEGLLRKKLPGIPLEVLNLGVSGSTSEHWLRKRAALFQFEPDIVVQYDGVNDLLWECLRRYAQAHPWRRRLYGSLLFQRLFPIPPAELDPQLEGLLANQERLARLARRKGALHLAGSFAGPDDERLGDAFRAHLDDLIRAWNPSTMRMAHYSDYARMLARYDRLFETAALSGRLNGVLVHRQISDPALFTDHCHLTPHGIARLAEAFLPASAAAVEARHAQLAANPAAPLRAGPQAPR